MGMWTMKTPSCDDEADARAEAKEDYLANLDPRNHDEPKDEDDYGDWRSCPNCGRMDEQEMSTPSRHAFDCEHVANVVRRNEEEEAEAKEHHEHLVKMCIEDPTLEIYYGQLRKKAV